MNFLRKFNLIPAIVATVCVAMFLLLSGQQWEEFSLEPTGTSLKRMDMEDLRFPAVSICDNHFDYGRAHEELGFPRSIFGMKPVRIQTNPYSLYRQYLAIQSFIGAKGNLTAVIWEYYFRLDSVLTRNKLELDVDLYCHIGAHSCSIGEIKTVPKDLESETFEVDVPAGKWITKIMADSDAGTNFMCHTLKPNVSVDFSRIKGNSIGITWGNISFLSNYWQVFIHDPQEDVIPQTHAIDTLPSVTFKKRTGTNKDLKKKAMILPKFLKLPKPNKIHPCNKNESYSKNNCNLRWGWKKKFQELTAWYGDNYTCQIPGLRLAGLEKEICQQFWSSDSNPVGIKSLLHCDDLAIECPPLLSKPPIGIYKPSSQCLDRCSSFSYTLVEQETSEYDPDMKTSDLYLYFASKSVETWTEYRLQGPLDFVAAIGGTLGLMLGLSLHSLVLVAIEYVKLGTNKLVWRPKRRIAI